MVDLCLSSCELHNLGNSKHYWEDPVAYVVRVNSFILWASEKGRVCFLVGLAFQNDFQAALEDCLRLRHWEAELNVTVPEILAFLAFHNEQLDPAYRAIVENNRWKK